MSNVGLLYEIMFHTLFLLQFYYLLLFFFLPICTLLQVGVLPMDESMITMKGRLGPGMMITVDLQKGQVCIL